MAQEIDIKLGKSQSYLGLILAAGIMLLVVREMSKKPTTKFA